MILFFLMLGVAFMEREQATSFSNTYDHFKSYCSNYNDVYLKLQNQKGEYDYFSTLRTQLNLASNNIHSLSQEQLEELKVMVTKQAENINKELETRKKDNDCIICYSNKKDICFYPCGHYCVCSVCSEQIKQCPICRVPIQKNVKLYDV